MSTNDDAVNEQEGMDTNSEDEHTGNVVLINQEIGGISARDDTTGLPTEERQRAMEQVLLQLNAQSNGAIRQLCESVDGFVRGAEPAERAALKYVLFCTLADISDENPHPYDTFLTQDIFDRVAHFEEVQSPAVQSVPLTRGSATLPSKDELLHALDQAGWIIGDGSSKENAIVYGGTAHFPTRVPDIAISSTKDLNVTAKIQNDFRTFLHDLRYQHDKDKSWRRLHIWSIDFLMELFFENLTGLTCLRQLNAIVSNVSKPTAIGSTRITIQNGLDFFRTNDTTPDGIESAFKNLRKLAILQWGENAYDLWKQHVVEMNFAKDFGRFSNSVDSNPAKTERQHIEAYLGETIGDTEADLINAQEKYTTTVLGLSTDQLGALYRRGVGGQVLSKHCHSRALLMLTHEVWQNLEGVDGSALEAACQQFIAVVPEFMSTMQKLDEFQDCLMNTAAGSLERLSGFQLHAGKEEVEGVESNWEALILHAVGTISPPATS